MNTEQIKQKLRSVMLYLSAHPDNEEDSETRDRLNDVNEILTFLNQNDMTLPILQLEEFQKAFNSTFSDDPILLSHKDWELRFDLSQEELNEYRDACENEDIVEIFDAILDRLFLAYGDAVSHGLQHILVLGFNEVVRSNMSKLGSDGKPIINGVNCKLDTSRPYGKILKSETYSKPDLKQFL